METSSFSNGFRFKPLLNGSNFVRMGRDILSKHNEP